MPRLVDASTSTVVDVDRDAAAYRISPSVAVAVMPPTRSAKSAKQEAHGKGSNRCTRTVDVGLAIATRSSTSFERDPT